MSKYIGDTEKNIAKVFSAARASHSMLLFDEADALFTKRVKVERSVDRFSNMEVNLLLQEIERFEGIVMLTTNLERDLDTAFQRRITFKIEFPFPGADHREKIWKKLIPPECPVDSGVDFGELAEAFELSGGHIKNVILRAAYSAASRGQAIGLSHFRVAAESECRSAGKLYRHIGD
jgi:SpoVK/Ycf46/Vps4 family AAA+-type ATPase